MDEVIKICILTIHDRERLSNAQLNEFTNAVMPVFKDKFPDTTFIFMSQELNLIHSGLGDLEHLLFEIKHALDELKSMRYDSLSETKIGGMTMTIKKGDYVAVICKVLDADCGQYPSMHYVRPESDHESEFMTCTGAILCKVEFTDKNMWEASEDEF